MSGFRTHAPRSSGFTLLEVLVAMAILGLLLSSVYATFFTTIKAIRSTEEQDDVHQVARLVMDQISRDLTMAFYRSTKTVDGEPKYIFMGRDDRDGEFARDRIDFLTTNHAFYRDGRPETDVVEVSYYIDSTYYDRPFLIRREDPLPDEELRHGGTLRILAEQVVALDFRFCESLPKPAMRQQKEEEEEEELEWHETWNSVKGKPARGLPQLVTVTLTIRDEQEEEHTYTTTVVLNPYQEG